MGRTAHSQGQRHRPVYYSCRRESSLCHFTTHTLQQPFHTLQQRSRTPANPLCQPPTYQGQGSRDTCDSPRQLHVSTDYVLHIGNRAITK